MMSVRNVGVGAAVAALALTAIVAASPCYAQSQPSAPEASVSVVPKKTLRQKVRALVAQITPDRIKRDIEFRKAAALFPDFCRRWEQDLHDREVNNLSKLTFASKDGYQSTTYTGYGKISSCESHQSKDGYSIGKLGYEEYIYYLVGKSEEEARRAQPKPISDLHTTEIFRWDNGKWFY